MIGREGAELADVANKKLVIDAVPSNVDQVIDFVSEVAGQAGCSTRVRTQLSICVDEIFANVSQYAYGDGVGQVWVRVSALDEQRIQVEFKDKGVPFDSLDKEDPDITLSAEDRAVGGLGIYLVKELADEVLYRREGEYNILTIIKKYDQEDRR